MTETAAEKTARLRALRYARDGHPDEIKAAKKEAKALLLRASERRSQLFFEQLGAAFKANPDRVVRNLEAIGEEAAKLTRQHRRIERL